MFGLVWIDNGHDCTMGLWRRVPEGARPDGVYWDRPMIFFVDDWYGMTTDLKKMGKLPEAPSNCPNLHYLANPSERRPL